MARICSCPVSLVSRIVFCCRPRVCKVFLFFVAPRWAPRPFGGARAKKKHHPRVFFFAPAPAKGRGRRSPVGRRHGARAKKQTPLRVCWAISARPGWDFFLLRPRGTRRANNKKCLVYYIGSKKTRRGRSKKKTPLPYAMMGSSRLLVWHGWSTTLLQLS